MQELNQDIKDAINKHLPTEAGTLLQKRLQQADQDASRVITLTEQIEKLEATLQEKQGLLDSYVGLQQFEESLNQREKVIFDREKKAEIAEAKLKATEAEKRADLAVSLVETVFKSPVYRKTISEQTSGSFLYSNALGRSEWVPTGPEYKTEETTEE